MKRCPRCREVKPSDQWTKSYCKLCKAAIERERCAARRGVIQPGELDRLWARIDKGGPVFRDLGPCWVWQGPPRKRDGYGAVHFSGRNVAPHLVTLMLAGRKAPEGLPFADHMCRNRLCCNPDHLRYVTPRINAIENNSGVSAISAAVTHCKHCKRPYGGENLAIYINPTTGQRQRVCLTCRPTYWRWAVVPRDPPMRSRKSRAQPPLERGNGQCHQGDNS